MNSEEIAILSDEIVTKFKEVEIRKVPSERETFGLNN